MPIRVTKQNAPRTSLAERRDLLRFGRNKLDPSFRQIGHGSRKVPGNQGCLQAPKVRRRGFARRLPAVPRYEIFEELDTGAGRGSQTGDSHFRAEYMVEVVLFRSIVQALAGDPKAKFIPVETQATLGIRNSDGRVVDA